MGRRGPKPGFKQRREAEMATAAAVAKAARESKKPAKPVRVAEPTVDQRRDPLQRGRNVDTMPEAELRTYARQIGITLRDAQGLAVDRLRQNCKARLLELIED